MKEKITLQDDLLQRVKEKVSQDPSTKKVDNWHKQKANNNDNGSGNQGNSGGESGGVFMTQTVNHLGEGIHNWVLLDGGASAHVFNSPEWFDKLDYTTQMALDAGTQTVLSEAVGSVTLVTETGYKICLQEVGYFPEFKTNVVSLESFTEKGYGYDNLTGRLWNPKNQVTVCTTEKRRRQNYISATKPISSANANSRAPRAVIKTPAELWHVWMGHPGPEAQARIAKASGVEFGTVKMKDCEICATTKLRKDRSRIPRDPAWPKRPWAVVSFDLFTFHDGYNGSNYLALFTCRFTSERKGYDIPFKTDLSSVWIKFTAWINRRFDLKVSLILTDNEKALFSDAFKEEMAFEGIEILFSSPAYPHQNGHAERSGGLVTHKAGYLLNQAGFPHKMWPTAVHTAIYLLNRTPREVDGGGGVTEQPIEQRIKWLVKNNPDWQGYPEGKEKQDLRHVRAYGCKAYPMTRKATRKQQGKFDPKAHIGYLAGIISSTQYLIWVSCLNKGATISTSFVLFDEKTLFGGDKPHSERIEKAQDEWVKVTEEDEEEEDSGPEPEACDRTAEGPPTQETSENAFSGPSESKHDKSHDQGPAAEFTEEGVEPEPSKL